MARVFTADVVLNLIDRLSGGLGASNRKISRELSYMERSFRQVNHAGFGLLAGFTGFASATVGVTKLTTAVMELSKAQNNLAMAATKAEGGILRVVTAQDRAAFRAAAARGSRAANILPQRVYEEMAITSRVGLDPAASAAVGPAMSKIAVTQNVTDFGKFLRGFVATQNDFLRPMGPKYAEKTITDAGEVYAEAANKFNVTAEEINETMALVGPMLQSAGYTLKEAVAMTGALALRRITGSQAGVFLRSEMVRMLDPTAKGMTTIQNLMHLVPEEDFSGLKGAEKKDAEKAYRESITNEFNKRYNITTIGGGKSFRDQFQAQFPDTPLGTKYNREFNEAARLPGGSEERHDAILDLMRKMGLTQGESESSIERSISAMMLRTSNRTDFDKFMKDFVAAGGTASELARIFQGRQSPRGLAYIQSRFEAMKFAKEPTLVTGRDRRDSSDPSDLRRSLIDQQLWEREQGPAGALLRMDAAMGRLADSMTTGPVGNAIVGAFDKLTSLVELVTSISNTISAQGLGKAISNAYDENPLATAIGLGVGGLAGLSLARGAGRLLGYGLRGFGGMLFGGGAAIGTAAAGAGGGAVGGTAWIARMASKLGISLSIMDILARHDIFGSGGPQYDDIRELLGIKNPNRAIPDLREGRQRGYGGPYGGNSILGIPSDEAQRQMADTLMDEIIGKNRRTGWTDSPAMRGYGGAAAGVGNPLADIADFLAHPTSGQWPAMLHDATLSALKDWGADTGSGGGSEGGIGGGGGGGGGGGFGGGGGRAFLGAHRSLRAGHAFMAAHKNIRFGHQALSTGPVRLGRGGLEIAPTLASLPPEAAGLLNTLARWETPGQPNYGYNTMFGGRQFTDMSQHPGGPGVHTDAGRYQFLRSTWAGVMRNHPDIRDFRPQTQDKAAWYLAQEAYSHNRPGRNLLADLRSGDPGVIAGVGHALHGTWVSTRSDFASLYKSAMSRTIGNNIIGGRTNTFGSPFSNYHDMGGLGPGHPQPEKGRLDIHLHEHETRARARGNIRLAAHHKGRRLAEVG